MPQLHDDPDRPPSGAGQRVTIERINRLLRQCRIVQESPISSVLQCSSSLFVLLFHRIFGVAVPDIELEPNTPEKKLNNMARVLAALRQQGVDEDPLSSISAREIVAQNEAHITRLIEVFLEIASSVWGTASDASSAHRVLDANRPEGLPSCEISYEEDSQLQHNVATWRRGIVDPYGTRLQRSMSQLHRRIRRIDTTMGGLASIGQCGAALVRRQATLTNSLTDDRIERLRAKRLVAATHQRIVSATVSRLSKQAVEMQHDARRAQHAERQHYHNVRRLAREEERKRQAAYAHIVDQALQSPAAAVQCLRCIDGTDFVGRVLQEHGDFRRLRQTVRNDEEGNQAMLSACLHRYEAALKRWRGVAGWDTLVQTTQ